MKLSQLAFLLLISIGLNACTSTPVPKPEAVDPNESMLIASIPGAPAPNSEEDLADWKALVDLQKHRTKKDCDRAAGEYEVSLAHFFGPQFGTLKKREVEKLTPFFDDLRQQAFTYSRMVKRHWKRPRPYDAHADLNPCIPKETSFSYPSGHTTVGRLYSDILSEIYPKRAKKFLARSEQIALDRNLAGVHYPSDTRDGKILGDKIYGLLKATDSYQKAIAQLKNN